MSSLLFVSFLKCLAIVSFYSIVLGEAGLEFITLGRTIKFAERKQKVLTVTTTLVTVWQAL